MSWMKSTEKSQGILRRTINGVPIRIAIGKNSISITREDGKDSYWCANNSSFRSAGGTMNGLTITPRGPDSCHGDVSPLCVTEDGTPSPSATTCSEPVAKTSPKKKGKGFPDFAEYAIDQAIYDTYKYARTHEEELAETVSKTFDYSKTLTPFASCSMCGDEAIYELRLSKRVVCHNCYKSWPDNAWEAFDYSNRK